MPDGPENREKEEEMGKRERERVLITSYAQIRTSAHNPFFPLSLVPPLLSGFPMQTVRVYYNTCIALCLRAGSTVELHCCTYVLYCTALKNHSAAQPRPIAAYSQS